MRLVKRWCVTRSISALTPDVSPSPCLSPSSFLLSLLLSLLLCLLLFSPPWQLGRNKGGKLVVKGWTFTGARPRPTFGAYITGFEDKVVAGKCMI